MHRVKISDGVNWGIGVFTSGPTEMVLQDKVKVNQLLRLTDYTITSKFCVIMRMELLPMAEGEAAEAIGGAYPAGHGRSTPAPCCL